jgi:hypothetical protein
VAPRDAEHVDKAPWANVAAETGSGSGLRRHSFTWKGKAKAPSLHGDGSATPTRARAASHVAGEARSVVVVAEVPRGSASPRRPRTLSSSPGVTVPAAGAAAPFFFPTIPADADRGVGDSARRMRAHVVLMQMRAACPLLLSVPAGSARADKH